MLIPIIVAVAAYLVISLLRIEGQDDNGLPAPTGDGVLAARKIISRHRERLFFTDPGSGETVLSIFGMIYADEVRLSKIEDPELAHEFAWPRAESRYTEMSSHKCLQGVSSQ